MLIMSLSPVAISLAGFEVRWYSLAYLVALLFAYHGGEALAKQSLGLAKKKWHNIVEIIFISGLVGGRLGHCLFYDWYYCWAHPLEVFYLWHGGMSFFGAILGVTVGLYLCYYRHGTGLLALSDIVCTLVPVGLGLGRLANLVNSECLGRATGKSWGIIFPLVDTLARYPTQLIEAVCEGVVLYFLISLIPIRYQGVRTGFFLTCYGAMRFLIEPYKEVESIWTLAETDFNPSMLLAAICIVSGCWLLYKSRNLSSND